MTKSPVLPGANDAAAKIAAMVEVREKEADRVAAQTTARDAALTEIRSFGALGAKGGASLTHAAMYFGQQVSAGVLTYSDAASVYASYQAGYSSANDQFVPEAKTDEKAVKASVSTLATFALPGAYGMGETLWRMVATLRHGVPASERKHNSLYQALAACNRAVSDVHVKQGAAMVSSVVTDAWLRDLLVKAPSTDKTAKEKLVDAFARIAKMAEKDDFAGTCLGETLAEIQSFITLLVESDKAPSIEAVRAHSKAKVAIVPAKEGEETKH